VRKTVFDAVNAGQECRQKLEYREGYNARHFYDIVVPCPEYPRGLYVEMRLVCRDADFPEVRIVNCHEAR